MLVLSRKKGESIVIAGRITVKVLDFGRNWVRLGIDAPPDVLILRSEIVVQVPEGTSIEIDAEAPSKKDAA